MKGKRNNSFGRNLLQTAAVLSFMVLAYACGSDDNSPAGQDSTDVGNGTIGGTVAEAIDLGLSVKWASHNLGASREEEKGTYFAWGEVNDKTNGYIEDTYQHFNYHELTYKFIGEEISNTKYDAAKTHWKEDWRLPTIKEFTELSVRCKWDWVRVNDVKGFRVTGPNGNSIFIPANGLICNKTLNKGNSVVQLWSGTAHEKDKYAFCLSTDLVQRIFTSGDERVWGMGIRPVKDKRDSGGNAGEGLIQNH